MTLHDQINAIARREMDRRARIVVLWLAGIAAILLLTACGGGDDGYISQLRGEIAPTVAPTMTPYPTPAAVAYPTSAPLPTLAATAPAEIAPTAQPTPLPTTTPYIVPTYTPAPAMPAVIVGIGDDTDEGTCWPRGVEPCKVVQP